MKRLALISISFLALTKTIYADSSDRFIVVYLGGGVNGALNSSSVTEIVPTNYTSNYPPKNPFIDLNSSSNVVNQMCKSGTCNLSSMGGGLSGEAGIKLRPLTFLEFDLWLGFDYSFMLNGGPYPNSIPLQQGVYEYINTYKKGKFAEVKSSLLQLSLNATATLRIWRFGFIGGVGGGLWNQNYETTLSNVFGDEITENSNITGNSLNLILGLSFMIGKNKGEGEVMIRFLMPFNKMVAEKGYSSNGYINYHESISLQPYMINIASRWYF